MKKAVQTHQVKETDMSYTDKEVARLQEFDSVSFAQAEALAVEFDRTPASVRSKVQSLEIPYVRKPTPAKRPTVLTKAQLVDLIAASFEDERDLTGLVGGTLASLNDLYAMVSAG